MTDKQLRKRIRSLILAHGPMSDSAVCKMAGTRRPRTTRTLGAMCAAGELQLDKWQRFNVPAPGGAALATPAAKAVPVTAAPRAGDRIEVETPIRADQDVESVPEHARAKRAPAADQFVLSL